MVVPILVSTGQVSKEKFPADLAGLPVVYKGDALLPHPEGPGRYLPGVSPVVRQVGCPGADDVLHGEPAPHASVSVSTAAVSRCSRTVGPPYRLMAAER